MSVSADVENPGGVASPSEAKTSDDIKEETHVTENNANAEKNVSDDNAADLLCGMKRCTAYIAIAIISAVLIVGITLGVIYGRPASWKVAVEYMGGPNFGRAMMISSDGSTLALLEESTRASDLIGVQVIPTLSSNEDRKATVPLSPFLQVDEEYPLPANSEFGDDFNPDSTYYDLSLSEDGNMIAILGYAFFVDKYRVEDDQGYRFHCNTTVVDPSERYEYMRCLYSRVTVFKRENSNSEWKSFGQPIEHMTSERSTDRRQVVSLSKNGKRLAIGYNGGVDIYQQDENDEWVQVGNSILVDDICGEYDYGFPVCGFGSSISLDNDGESIAVSGFKSSKTAVYKLMGDSWEVMGEELPVSLPLTVSLSDGGKRVAVAHSLRPFNYDDPPAEIQVFEYNADNDSWLQLPSIDGFQECCNDSTAGSGVSISGDGNTIVYSTLAQPYRFGGNEWSPVGQALESGRGDTSLASITGDGDRVVIGEVSFFSGNSWVKVYDLRRGL